MMKKELLTLKEVCEMLGIDHKTFARNHIGDKLRIYKVGKRVKYSAADVERLRLR